MARYEEGSQLLRSFHYHFRLRRNYDHCCKQVWKDSTILEDWRPWLTRICSKHTTDSFYMTLTFTGHVVSCIVRAFSDGCTTSIIGRGTQHPELTFPLPLGKLLFSLGYFLWVPFCIQSNLLHSECSWDGKYWTRSMVIPDRSFIQSNECPPCWDPSSLHVPITPCIMKSQKEIKAFILIFGIASWAQTCLIRKNVLWDTPQTPNQKTKQLRALSQIRNNDWPFKSLNCLII